ncbi:hypothetical protein BH11VER1_BH11VER1_23400 [soil metagenome]
MRKNNLTALIAFFCLGHLVPAKAIITNLPDALQKKSITHAQRQPASLGEFLNNSDSTKPTFPYWEHVGMVGKGSGVYLGDGWVITSAHVGCFPFLMSDGSNYKPVYSTWKVLTGTDGAKSDLAVFQVLIPDKSSRLASLENLPVGVFGESHAKGVVMIGTGYTQADEALTFNANGKAVAVLGYRVQPERHTSWGVTPLTRILDQSVKTGQDCHTECLATTFDSSAFAAQAVDGDSGGASFAYNTKSQRWELVGCIIAVSQQHNQVTFGTHTYLGNLGRYAEQIPGVDSTTLAQAVLAREQGKATTAGNVSVITAAPTAIR